MVLSTTPPAAPHPLTAVSCQQQLWTDSTAVAPTTSDWNCNHETSETSVPRIEIWTRDLQKKE